MLNNNVLIVIDMQNGFTTGSLANKAAVDIIPAIVKRINEFDGELIVATRDTHQPDYFNTQEGRKLPVKHCIYGTNDWLIVPEIQDALNSAYERGISIEYVDKPTFGYAHWNDIFDEYYCLPQDDIECVDMVGTCTGICVISNASALKAVLPETEINVIANECACLTPETHETALKAMELMQINIIRGE